MLYERQCRTTDQTKSVLLCCRCHRKMTQETMQPASWLSGNAFVSGVEGLSLKSRAGQIGYSVANGLPPLQHFFERSCVARAQRCGDGPRQLVTRFGELQRV